MIELSINKTLLPTAFLVLACLFLFTPGIATLPPTDRDEARFVQASRQMLETGDFTRIRFQEAPRNKKPAGAYWLQTLSVSVFSNSASSSIWPYRLPSALAATLAVLSLFFFTSARLGTKIGLASALVLASSVVLIAESHLAKSDAILLLCVTAMQTLVGATFLNPNLSTKWLELLRGLLVWTALACGFLVKGPVAPGIFVLTVCFLLWSSKDRKWFWKLRPLEGLILAALIVLPWLLKIQSATSGQFLSQSWREDILPKFFGVHESHGGPPGYYAALSLVTLWPWSILLPSALMLIWRKRQEPLYAFLLAWIAPAWLVLEITPTKLPHYSLPLFPALSIGIALTVITGIQTLNRYVDKIHRFLWFLVSSILLVLPVSSNLYFGSGLQLWSIVSSGCIALSMWFVVKEKYSKMGIGSIGVVILLACVAPSLTMLWPSKDIVAAFSEMQDRDSRLKRIASTGFSEPSLVFLSGTNTILAEPEELARLFHGDCSSLYVVREKELARFQAALLAPESAIKVGNLRAFNYSKGKWMDLNYYRGKECLG